VNKKFSLTKSQQVTIWNLALSQNCVCR